MLSFLDVFVLLRLCSGTFRLQGVGEHSCRVWDHLPGHSGSGRCRRDTKKNKRKTCFLKLLVTSASLLLTSALLVVTRASLLGTKGIATRSKEAAKKDLFFEARGGRPLVARGS